MEWIDKILRIDRFNSSSDLVRIRAIMVTVGAFLFIQFINLLQMQLVYGGWTIDSSIAVAAMSVTLALLLSYRYHDKFYVAALTFTIFMVAAIYLSASVEKTGINSALVPLMPICVLLAAFISGWRTCLVTGIIMVAFTGILYEISSSSHFLSTLDATEIGVRNKQRALQLGMACLLATIIAAQLSIAMHGIFNRDKLIVDQVKEAERKRTAFLSSLSHEIRTPLNGILGMSGLMMKTDLTDQQKQYAGIVAQCSQNLMDVMGNVMEFSQLDSRRIVLKNENFDLHTLAKALVQTKAEDSPDKDVIVGLHIASSVPRYVFTDKKRLQLVMDHLLTNALTYTQSGSVNLLLQGKRKSDGNFNLEVYVRDTGIGIEKEGLERIFEPFHQLDNSLSRKYEGTGLGLALCKEIIEFMGGKIGVVSELNKGSTFFFTLDLPVEASMNLKNIKALRNRKKPPEKAA